MSFTHQSQKRKIRGRIDRAGYEKIKLHINTSPTQLEISCASQRVPKNMNGYALEDRDENAGNRETDNKMVEPQEYAAEFNDGEDAILEEDAMVLYALDTMTYIDL